MGGVNNSITRVVIHCSDSPHGRNDDAREIHRWHTSPPRKWAGIGYHFVITETGERQAGRPWYWQGAHAHPHNLNSIGICMIGEHGDFTGAQLLELRALYNDLRSEWPDAEWLNHYQINPGKTCPGFDAVRFLEND